MTPVKIQINSLEALERLLGNDTELEAEIRKNIAYDFTKKYLKDIVTKDFVAKTEKALSLELADVFLTKESHYPYKVKLSNEGKEKLSSYVEDNINKTIRTIVDEKLEELEIRKKVEEKLTSFMCTLTDELSRKLQDNYLDRLVQNKLKEKLGL